MAPKRKKAAVSKEVNEDAGEPQKKCPKTASKKAKKKQDEDQDENVVTTSIANVGQTPVDSFCTAKIGKAHVYVEDGVVWDAMLNQTNIQFNNNKFYLIQLLEDTNRKDYSVWLRWGRVGKNGQNKLSSYGPRLDEAKESFTDKFYDKTRNEWKDKNTFEKVPGKYDLLQMDFKPTKAAEEPVKETKSEIIKVNPSKLDEKVQNLMKLICDIQAMEETVLEMKYDSKKSPLGKLTEEQIKAGYSALKEIEELLKQSKTQRKMFVEASNRFYTRIPHNFGMKVPPVIDSEVQIIEKMQLLQVLSDIEVAMKILNEKKDSFTNPIDSHYKSLNCKLETMDPTEDMYKTIECYLKDTHAKTHSMYKLKVLDIFSCSKEVENDKFLQLDNRMLLWHGSRLSNIAGILKQGLRIAPPEAPSTGYMFGKGVYFADRSSKSANYCFASNTNDVGILLLCEVALGKSRELKEADYKADKLPKGYDSVKGLGAEIPNPSSTKTLPDGTVVPMGKGKPSENSKDVALFYNEYIVYDVNQIKLKYVVMVQFKFK